MLRQPTLARHAPSNVCFTLRPRTATAATAPSLGSRRQTFSSRRARTTKLIVASAAENEESQQEQTETSLPFFASSSSTTSSPPALAATTAETTNEQQQDNEEKDPRVIAAEEALLNLYKASAEIFKLVVLLPLRYLVLMPLGWALTRLGIWAIDPEDVLKRLEEANSASKLKADDVATVLRSLNRHHPQAVVDFVDGKGLLTRRVLNEEEGTTATTTEGSAASTSTERSSESTAVKDEELPYAINAAVVKEYLIALVRSGKIKNYSGDGEITSPPADGHSHRSLGRLLEEMKAAVQGVPVTAAPGTTIAHPLHVIVQGGGGVGAFAGGRRGRKTEPTGILATISSIFWFLFTCIFFALAWAVGASTIRRLNSGGGMSAAGGNGISTSAAGGISSGFPGIGGAGGGGGASMASQNKEYNKENIPEKSQKSFKDVKGCDEAITELQEIVQYLKSPEKFTRLGGKLPKGVLLTGPPGTGKTLLARAVAGEAGVPFFYKSGSEFDEMFVGVGSRRVRSLFAAAKKKAPCIVFIDEVDAVGGKRTNWESSGGSRKTLNQLLTDMDGFEENSGVVVMAATNLQELLDPALTRPGRFDRQVAVSLPDVRGRQQIIDLYLQGKPVAKDVDSENIARRTPGFSGADLANLVNEAALLAARNDADEINASLLDEARDKVLMGSPRSLVQSIEARRLTAYHEGGHALIALYTPGAKPIHKATIVPRGHALGMVSQVPDKDEYSTTKQQMMAHIDVCMGGKAAEELIFGSDFVTSGATSDLKTATKLAKHMVEDCGMSERIGPVAILDGSNGNGGGSGSVGDDVRKAADEEVSKILKESYSRVATLLKNKEKELHALATELLEKETLTQREIKGLLWGEKVVKEEEEAIAALKAAEDAAMLELIAAREARETAKTASSSAASAAATASMATTTPTTSSS
jgi:ATP-dependent metalloprotease